MENMIYRDLFGEWPYGAALADENLLLRCSTCFAEGATVLCADDEESCKRVVYCSKECRDWDQANHAYECKAFRKVDGGNIDQFVRLLARILSRWLIDHGFANLSENFPENVRDRCLADLISHQHEIEQNDYRSQEMASALQEFFDLFSDTPLTDDADMAKRMCCVMWINCFSVSGPLNLKIGHESSLGLGFYLNVSRFDHSCRPDLHVHFDGARIVIQYPSSITQDDPEAVAEERLALTESPKKFNQLTISYGFSSAFTNDSYFPLRRQRRESLAFGYYFKCYCVLCSDNQMALLEVHAAPIECKGCGEPYVWRQAVTTRHQSYILCWLPASDKLIRVCRKSCKCDSSDEELEMEKEYVRDLDLDTELPALEQEWANVMACRMQDQYAQDIIDRCQPVWDKACLFWHRTGNLRMTHLQERLFTAYNVMVMDTWETENAVDPHMLNMALVMGEASIAWYKRYGEQPYDTAKAAYGYELAQLYDVSASIADSTKEAIDAWNRASYWFTFAASVWQTLRDYATGFVEQLMTDAGRMESAVADAMEQKLMTIDEGRMEIPLVDATEQNLTTVSEL